MTDDGSENFLTAVDLHGLIHAVAEADVPDKGKAFWNRCGGGDAGAIIMRNREVSCPNCLAILQRERQMR